LDRLLHSAVDSCHAFRLSGNVLKSSFPFPVSFDLAIALSTTPSPDRAS
jgi:hypothetical protein